MIILFPVLTCGYCRQICEYLHEFAKVCAGVYEALEEGVKWTIILAAATIAYILWLQLKFCWKHE